MYNVLKWNKFSICPFICSLSFQHFEPIEYVNGVARFSPSFEANASKILINLDEFLSLLK
jgi:hypothetical protein